MASLWWGCDDDSFAMEGIAAMARSRLGGGEPVGEIEDGGERTGVAGGAPARGVGGDPPDEIAVDDEAPAAASVSLEINDDVSAQAPSPLCADAGSSFESLGCFAAPEIGSADPDVPKWSSAPSRADSASTSARQRWMDGSDEAGSADPGIAEAAPGAHPDATVIKHHLTRTGAAERAPEPTALCVVSTVKRCEDDDAVKTTQHSDGTSETTVSSSSGRSSSSSCEPSPKKLTLPRRYALSMARRPAVHISATLLICVAVTVIVAIFGNKEISVGNLGWLTRGTLIADRATQMDLALKYSPPITKEKEKQGEGEEEEAEEAPLEEDEFHCSGKWHGNNRMMFPDELNLNSVWKTRDADEESPSASALDADALHELCVAEEATLKLLEERDLCHKCPVEGGTSRCPRPYSLAGLARVYVDSFDGKISPNSHLVPTVSCDELRDRWTGAAKAQFTSILTECSNDMMMIADGMPKEEVLARGGCLASAFPVMTAPVVDRQFLVTGIVKYTSSIFATKRDHATIRTLFEMDRSNLFPSPDRATEGSSAFEDGLYEVGVNALYATGRQGFYEMYLMGALTGDVAISLASMVVTALCIVFHTRSPFLTLLGLAQIIFALPLAYFVYYFVCGLPFFPFININAVFVVFALGADDIFVSVDKWKMKRRKLPPHYTTEQVAAAALPDAAYATFVTSITTSVAFFASAVIKVPAISLFAIYCGLVVAMDYVLSILLVFPALCIYDRRLGNGSKSLWWSLAGCGERGRACGTPSRSSVPNSNNEDDEECAILPDPEMAQSLGDANGGEAGSKRGCCHRMLAFHYKILHKLRWPLLILSLAAIAACASVAMRFPPPAEPDPPFLPKSNRYEAHRHWSFKLLSKVIIAGNGGKVSLVFGLTPTDTGSHLNPRDPSKIVFDPTFVPSEQATQVYLLDLCNKVYGGDRKILKMMTGSCPMREFGDWLHEQSKSNNSLEAYESSCEGADSVPVPSDVFDSCMIAFDESTSDNGTIVHDGEAVKVLAIRGRSNATLWSPFAEQAEDWHAVEAWTENEKSNAPAGAGGFFQTSFDSWLYDTLHNMRVSAYASASIALACASAMILLTSRSVTVMLFSAVSIAYVLAASSACLIGLGWTLGLFESVLFSLLIGIGCDFVLHFGHAYTLPPGVVSKEERTRRALMHMGPSVLGSAFTTMSTAIIMLFTTNLFSRKFALMLAMTILHSAIGSFVVFLVLCDCIGPSSTCSRGSERKKAVVSEERIVTFDKSMKKRPL